MNGLFYIAIRHDDWCLYWFTNDPGSCNCNPTYERTEITDENMEEMVEQIERNEDCARKLRRSKRS